MLKSRISQWGFQKKNKERKDLKRAGVDSTSTVDADLTKSQNNQLLPALVLPEPTHYQYILIAEIDYLASRHCCIRDPKEFEPNYAHGNPKYINLFIAGTCILRSGGQSEGFHLLREAFRLLPALFDDPMPFTAFLELFHFTLGDQDQTVISELWRFLAAYSSVILHTHPIRDVLQTVYKLHRQYPEHFSTSARQALQHATIKLDNHVVRANARLMRMLPLADPYLCKERDFHFSIYSLLGRLIFSANATGREVPRPVFLNINFWFERYELAASYPQASYDLAQATIKHLEDWNDRSHIAYAVCKSWVALWHHQQWVSSGEHDVNHPHHQVAIYHLQNIPEEAWLSPKFLAETINMYCGFSYLQREAGLEEDARKTELTRDRFVRLAMESLIGPD